MRKNRSISSYITSQETVGGFVYFAFQMLALPSLLRWCNAQLSSPLNDAELNFVFYLVNFTHHPAYFAQAIVLGFVAYFACRYCIGWLIRHFVPGFTNYNDASIAAMKGTNHFLMLIGTVVLAPPYEECIYRGLIFRNLYGKSRWAAYIVSILAFAIIHIIGYIGRYSAVELLLAVLQYLPAGLWLAWSYAKGDSIFVPILIHAAINYVTITGMR